MSFTVLPKKGLSRAQVEAEIDAASAHLPWLTGTFHDISDLYPPSAKATTTVSANTLYGHPVWVPDDAPVDAIALPVFTAGAASTAARLGLYTMNRTTLLPGTLIAEGAAPVATDATGDKLATISQTLTAGTWYWLTAVFSGAPAINNYALNANPFGMASAAASATVGVTASHTYGALPATFPAATRSTTLIRLSLRVA